jgi:ribosome-binding protein aMBF1 (putative translation factor)
MDDEMVPDDKTLAQQFGSRVRALRKKRGMTQKQLAEATELSVNFISFAPRVHRIDGAVRKNPPNLA